MRPSCGFLLVDKPRGVTSFDVIAALRGVLHTRKVGHSGTLDPQATGLLLIGFGSMTRLLSLFHSVKTYEATIRLGASTDTDDAAGALHHSQQSEQIREKMRKLCADPSPIFTTIATKLTGHISQVPSSYSAVRVNGHHAYDLARAGQSLTLAARSVTIERFDVDPHSVTFRLGRDAKVDSASSEQLAISAQSTGSSPFSDEDVLCDFSATITCSEGTYIRSLARDLGAELGVGGYVTSLRRTRVGTLDVTDAASVSTREKTYTDRDGITHTRLKAYCDADEVSAHILPAAELVWQALPAVRVSQEQAHLLETGLPCIFDVHMDANKAGLAVLSQQTTATAHTDSEHSTHTGQSANRLVAICGDTCVGVVEIQSAKRAEESPKSPEESPKSGGSRALRPRMIVDQTFVRGVSADHPGTHHRDTDHRENQERA